MQVGWVKIGDFRQITRYISKTVQDIKVRQKVTDWLTECLYYDIWQTANKITMHVNNINDIVCIIIIIIFLTPVLNSRGMKKLRYAI